MLTLVFTNLLYLYLYSLLLLLLPSSNDCWGSSLGMYPNRSCKTWNFLNWFKWHAMETSPRLFALNGVSVGPHLLQASLNIGGKGNSNNLRREMMFFQVSHNYFILVLMDFQRIFSLWCGGFAYQPHRWMMCVAWTQVVHPLLSFDPVRIEAVDTSGSVEIQGVQGLILLKGAQGSLSKKMRYSSYEIHLRIFNILPGNDGVFLLRGCMSKTENKGMSVMNWLFIQRWVRNIFTFLS